ncbi:uncharacterized protein LOC124639575 [Helicoverpa zea]|uniref:uncharacterized protein LOC124639575 n=1 Tax=Helicoverpa zea TaxID=7113 RepID=UPI001F5A412D|nr:uncharacterized protein LOC124639575 [Helicoverpa zea]
MAKMSSARNVYILLTKNTSFPSTTITRTNTVIPNAIRIPENSKKESTKMVGVGPSSFFCIRSAEGEMLNNIRMAITPGFGYGFNTYETGKPCKPNTTSSLAGDPRRLTTCQNIRAEILEKWSKRPKPDIQKEWLKNLMFN